MEEFERLCRIKGMETPTLEYIPIKTTVSEKFLRSCGIKIGTDTNKQKMKVPMPEKYIINEDATILFWTDGTKTVVKRCTEDEFNKRLGFLTAFFQHYSGMSKNKANKFLAKLEVEEENKNKETSKSEYTKDNLENSQKNKFNIGDKVRLKENITDTYGICDASIKRMKNKTLTIAEISKPNDWKPIYSYYIENFRYYVTEDMIEKENKNG